MSDPRQPWMKFYPADWRADAALRLCSLTARGLWLEMLALMHASERYGHLEIGGKQPTAAQLAVLVGSDVRSVERALAELEAAGVFSRADDGAIYSRRMLRDREKAERDRANGKRGGNPRLRAADKEDNNPPDNPPDNGWDNEGVNPPDKAQKPEARIIPPHHLRWFVPPGPPEALGCPWTGSHRPKTASLLRGLVSIPTR